MNEPLVSVICAGAIMLASSAVTAVEVQPPPPDRHEQHIDAGKRAIDLVATNGWILIQFWAYDLDKRENDKAQRYYALTTNNFFMSLKAMGFFQ